MIYNFKSKPKHIKNMFWLGGSLLMTNESLPMTNGSLLMTNEGREGRKERSCFADRRAGGCFLVVLRKLAKSKLGEHASVRFSIGQHSRDA